MPMYLRARLGVGYLPQEPSVFRRMTAAENILAVLETLGLRRAERLKRLEELLAEFGIQHVRHTRADALSGGTAPPEARLGTEPHFISSTSLAGIDSRKRWTHPEISSTATGGIGILHRHNVARRGRHAAPSWATGASSAGTRRWTDRDKDVRRIDLGESPDVRRITGDSIRQWLGRRKLHGRSHDALNAVS